ncbi:MAG: response regulator [Saprospiraceae bacterium]
MSDIRVLLADDHELFRKGLAHLLTEVSGVAVAGEATDGVTAVQLALQLKPCVILMDVALPVMDGVEATRSIISVNARARILALSSAKGEEPVINMVKAGARGYILKESPFDELVLAIRALSLGNSYFDKKIFSVLTAHLEYPAPAAFDPSTSQSQNITEREFEVLRCIAGEYTNKEIAAMLFISPRTVETHRRNLIRKLKVKNTAGLVKYYLRYLATAEEHLAIQAGPRLPG